MIDYSKINPRWYMPSRYYSKDFKIDESTIMRMVVLDVCDLVCGVRNQRDFRCINAMNEQTSPATRKAQYEWLDRVLSEPSPPSVTTMWKVVVGHWGVYSFAGNSKTPELIQHLEPILKRHHVHVYFSGHDHSLQHIRRSLDPGWRPHYFVSGAGGYRVHQLEPNALSDPDLIRGEMVNGFMWVRATSQSLRVQFIDMEGVIIYTTDVLPK